jgi:hypothetical protein
MLRCVADGTELEYAPITGAIRRGKRPPKLQPLEVRGPASRVRPSTETRGALSNVDGRDSQE